MTSSENAKILERSIGVSDTKRDII